MLHKHDQADVLTPTDDLLPVNVIQTCMGDSSQVYSLFSWLFSTCYLYTLCYIIANTKIGWVCLPVKLVFSASFIFLLLIVAIIKRELLLLFLHKVNIYLRVGWKFSIYLKPAPRQFKPVNIQLHYRRCNTKLGVVSLQSWPDASML